MNPAGRFPLGPSPLSPPGRDGPGPVDRQIGARPIVPQSGVPFREPDVRHDGLFNFPPAVPGLDAPGQPPPAPVHEPGGDLVRGALHPSVEVVDHLYRKGPQSGWFSPGVTNQNPTFFEIGSYNVPGGNYYWFVDYGFELDRPSGLFAGASVPVPGESLTGILGFDVTVNAGARRGTLLFQLDPEAVTAARTAFNQPTSNPSASRAPIPQNVFDANRYQKFALTSGQGTTLLPPTSRRQGPPNGPWLWVIGPGARLAFTCVIYRPVPVPLTAVGVRHTGYLLGTALSEALLERMRPR